VLLGPKVESYKLKLFAHYMTVLNNLKYKHFEIFHIINTNLVLLFLVNLICCVCHLFHGLQQHSIL